MIRVSGIALGRNSDTGEDDPPERIAQMVDNFAAGAVPIVAYHRGGPLVGWVDHVERVGAVDIAFTGEVFAHLADAFREPVPISIEAVEYGSPVGAKPGTDTWLATKRHWRGEPQLGWNLVGIALSDVPAARGSYIALDAEAGGFSAGAALPPLDSAKETEPE